ncbi:ATP-binding cassette, subfamily F, member 3 [Desulfotomaculum arcticum]|uniref:ATP-binding cassette, subfamily F, member 3 n=1 Tax=Desulfotruncus arcticus DSM 17038 TaxID=1121424 RepID=A0A1I2QET5_9FIRM|nr:ABC-F family ATP-binding cassette domain-containing protein [Desulfotruncus arcticus]SFG26470.1 ATP-binding cassette, subfamily F, member 3 [Desulfotomaculum arcticum] [Desulfotruncus arcticus DSM 17038]
MIVLQAAHIDKSFGSVDVLKNATLSVREGERVGLVGRNGAGKTTLLKIITGNLQPDTGEIIRPRGISIGYLAQGGGQESNRTVWNEMLDVFAGLIQQENRLRALEANMSALDVSSNQTLFNKVTEEYTLLRESFSRNGGYEYEAALRSVLHGLKFTEEYYQMMVNNLSGGEKTRLALAKLLLTKPNVLILDEPTNYLDLETMGWLERYLQSYPGAILAVSHDRYFLDALAQTIYELEFCSLTKYNGNYSRYLTTKAEELERRAKQYKKQQEDIARLEDFVRRNIARASTTGRAKSKQKLLEKIKPLEKPSSDNHKISLALEAARHSGKEVLIAKELSVGYNGKPVSRNINFTIYRGERVALLGPNGTGKTTLLKTVAGVLTPLAGTIRKGYHVLENYYDQEQTNLNYGNQVINELWDDFPDFNEQDIRAVLGRFLFTGDDGYKLVGDLSGGEKSRLALAKLICGKANLLLLDEPTSHLDILSNEALEEALSGFEGTLLFISHDRYFINKIATRVFELTETGIQSFQGNFNYYQSKKADLTTLHSTEGKTVTEGKSTYLRRKEVQREERKKLRRYAELEALICSLEEEIKALENELYEPEIYNDHEAYRQKNSTMEKLRQKLENCMGEWVKLSDTITDG